MINIMEKARCLMQAVMYMMVNGKTTKDTVKEFFNFRMEINTMDNGTLMIEMERAS